MGILKEYTVIEKKSITELITEVKNFANKGWTLVGGVSVRNSGSGLVAIYSQAMALYGS